MLATARAKLASYTPETPQPLLQRLLLHYNTLTVIGLILNNFGNKWHLNDD